jgi:hypothetical protein
VTEFNVDGALYPPRDDGSFSIPESRISEAMKANLTVWELTHSEKFAARVPDWRIGPSADGPIRRLLFA